MMKNQPFSMRFKFAINGIKLALQSERSFRTQILFSVLSLILLMAIRPKPMWWALFLMANSTVIGAELINTSIEAALDRLHPEKHELIAKAKDCAAAAVLVTSIAAVGIFIALVYDTFFIA